MKKMTNKSRTEQRQNQWLSIMLMLVSFLLLGFNASAQVTQTFNTTGTFVVPIGVTTVQVEAWGAGGAGGGNTTNNDGGGGGGGGAYSKTTNISVIGSPTHAVTVGVGGNGTTVDGTAGGDSWFSTTGVLLAKGGAGGISGTFVSGASGGAGGATATGVGAVKFAGGNGGNGRNSNAGQGGPGGSSAGTAANGVSGATTWATVTAANAPTGGGKGGNGGTQNNNGNAGAIPGAGGGGSGDGNVSGGGGAAGRVLVIYNCPAYALTTAATANGPFCGASSSTVTLRSSSLLSGTYTVTYNLTGATTATGSTANMIFTTGSPGAGTFGTSSLGVGTTNITITALTSAGCVSTISSNNTASSVVVGAPTAVAGTAIITCSNIASVNITAGSSATNNAGITWTSNGTGTFSNANSLTTCTYTPSAADIAAGSRILTLTATGNSPCGDAISTKTLTISALPTAVAGTPITSCSSSGAVNITAGSSATNQASVNWSSTGTGTFANPTSLTTCTYNPSAADISAGGVTLTLTAVAAAGCSNATSNKSFSINAVATAVAGTAAVTCSTAGAVNITAGSSATNNGGIIWSTSNGTGSFTNATSLTNCFYTPSAADIAAGSRTLVLTATGNAPCGDITSIKTITISSPSTAVAGTPITTCSFSGAVSITAGSSATNQTAVNWTSSGTGTFANANSLTTATYNPSAADITAGAVTLTLTASNPGCASATSTKIMAITSPAAAPGVITGTAVVCQAIAGINYSISPVAGATLYTWTVPTGWTITSGQGSTSINVTSGNSGQNGNVAVVASNSCGSTNPSQTSVVNINPAIATNNTGFTSSTAKTDGNITCASALSSPERRGYAKFSLSGLPSGAVVTAATLSITNNAGGALSGVNNDVTALGNNDPVATAAVTLFAAIGSGASYSSTTWNNTGTLALTLNATARTDIQTRAASPGYIAMGLQRGLGNSICNFFGYGGGTNAPKLALTYTAPRALAVIVNPVPTATVPAAQTYCNAVVTSPTPLTGTPAGVTFNISGGAAIGLADVSGVTAIPSFTPTLGSATLSITPIASGCIGTAVNYALTVNPIITPTFSPVAAICAGGALSPLPTTSNNGVTGTWSPTLNNNTTTLYTFTPNSGQCTPGTLTTLTITANANTTYYADTDGDSYGNLASTNQTCLGQPSGYVTNSTDCDDTNASLYQNGSFYTDADNDGYNNGAPQSVVCYGNTTPTGYVATNNGTDCNDFNTEINVWHVEVLGNGADDNCDGQIDEVGPVSVVTAFQCGITLAHIATTIYAAQVPAATGYRFEVTNGNSTIFDTTVNNFSLVNLAGGVLYATTYTIRVSVQIGGFWQAYGSPCTVTTPATPATTNVVNAQCGMTLTGMSNTIYCNQVTAANHYRFEVSDGINPVRTFDTGLSRFSMVDLVGGCTYATTYTVRVALRFGAVWQVFGDPCNITTPLAPGTTNVIPAQCGITISNSWTTIYATQVPEATGYRFEVVNGASTRFFDTPNARFNLHNLAGAPPAANTTCTIRVAILFNNIYQPFGSACTFTTAGVITRNTNAVVSVFAAKVYPNPYAATFKLNLDTSSEANVSVKVYDMLGRTMEARQASVADLSTLELGSQYPAGVYNVIVTQGDAVKILRVIKR